MDKNLIKVELSSSAGSSAHQEIFGVEKARSIESLYGKKEEAWIKVIFLKHIVKIKSMYIQAEQEDADNYMSNNFTF